MTSGQYHALGEIMQEMLYAAVFYYTTLEEIKKHTGLYNKATLKGDLKLYANNVNKMQNKELPKHEKKLNRYKDELRSLLSRNPDMHSSLQKFFDAYGIDSEVSELDMDEIALEIYFTYKRHMYQFAGLWDQPYEQFKSEYFPD